VAVPAEHERRVVDRLRVSAGLDQRRDVAAARHRGRPRARRRRTPPRPGPGRSAAPSEKRFDFSIAILAFALAAGFATWVRTAPLGSERQDPQILVARLGANGAHHVLYCTPVTWCDDAAPYGNIRVLVDDRVENATAARLDAQQKIAHVRPGWRDALRDSGADAILVERESPLAQMLPAQNGWTIGLADDTAALYLKAAGSR
jgi:anti-sigma-K factor RskA